ncbi:MAG: 50S ribosomal protein L9 [Myxococcota bacterium]
MASVQVVLKQNIDKLGQSGELVRVKAGYARNFLIPRGMAAIASRANVAQIEHERKLAQKRQEKLRAEIEAEAKKLKGLRVQIAKEAGPEGKLFGSVTAQEVSDVLKIRGLVIEKKRIVMPDEPVKMTGDYAIRIKFGAGVSVEIELGVVTKS